MLRSERGYSRLPARNSAASYCVPASIVRGTTRRTGNPDRVDALSSKTSRFVAAAGLSAVVSAMSPQMTTATIFSTDEISADGEDGRSRNHVRRIGRRMATTEDPRARSEDDSTAEWKREWKRELYEAK